MTAISPSPLQVRWLVGLAALSLVTLAGAYGPFADRTWDDPQLLFSLVTVAAAACVVGATIVIALADRREMAEVGLLGGALMAASVMSLVHGLVTPGVLYDETEAFRTASFLSLPVAVVAAIPVLRPRTALGRLAARRWRDWTLLTVGGAFTLASVVVFFPDAIVVPSPTDPMTIAACAVMAVSLAALSLRQLRFYDLGRRGANLAAAVSLAILAVSALLPVLERTDSPAFWWLHVTGAIGVLGACLGIGISDRMSRSAQEILAPILARDPLAAFELGLSPVVHQFVADVESKDQMTRDHTIRTGELAIRVGERFRLSGRDLRDLGLAAMLHDIGKLRVPDEILKKPGRLTVDEYEVVKLHTVHGEEMLAAEPALASAAPIVRAHHEHLDGNGYPDGLIGEDIPLAARIIAVCDAFDAMTHDGHHRAAMPVEMAHAVLCEHAGIQWDRRVIDQLLLVLSTMPVGEAFDSVGRPGDRPHASLGAWAEVPDGIDDLLEAVDAEI